MNLRLPAIGPLLALALSVPRAAVGAEAAPTKEEKKAIQEIARGIEALKKDYPQLAGFSAAKHCRSEDLSITYEFKTHEPERRGGWTSGVPNPDPDGIWFFVDIHDPGSTRQIHTQPVVEQLCWGNKRVMLLMLEGEKTKHAGGAIRGVLLKNGVKRCSEK
jgi:hypothetical protein